ncbi:WD40-repeat-containing domain protein [Neocallimastix sp. 'constans']
MTLNDRQQILFEDYTGFIIPNTYKKTFIGHENNIKCVAFAGRKGTKIISGSRVWNTQTAQCLGDLEGHTSRIWDISTNQSGILLASASTDGTTKLWDLEKMICTATLTENGNDIYSVNFHSSENYIVNAGYDKTIQLYDISTGLSIKTISSYLGEISSVDISSDVLPINIF